MAQAPNNLKQFSSMGTPVKLDEWYNRLWERCWNGGDTGITSRPIVRDTFDPITLDHPLPDGCFVMEKFHEDEFVDFGISEVYVRDSFIKFVYLIIESHGGGHGSSTAIEEFINPFIGFKAKCQKVFIILGAPGNGKSVFLYFLLHCRLQAKLPTILQTEHDELFLFTEYGVCRFRGIPFSAKLAPRLSIIAPDMWCLVDSNPENLTPSRFLQLSMLSIIESASPRQSRITWALKSKVNLEMRFMPPFSLEEVVIARSLQQTSPSERQLKDWFEKFVPSARLAYAHAANIRGYELMLELSLTTLENRSVVALCNRARSFADDGVSHQIFSLLPDEHYEGYTFHVPTRYLCKKLLEHFSLRDKEQRKELFRAFLHNPYLAAPAGYLMEDLFHTFLPLGGSWRLLTLSTRDCQVNQRWKRDDSEDMKWLAIGFPCLPEVHISSSDPSSGSSCCNPLKVVPYHTLDSAQLTDCSFYIPQSPNQVTFDSFYYFEECAYMFQSTVSAEHTVKEGGLKMTRQLGVKKVIYIGVVPTGREEVEFVITRSVADKYKDLIIERYLLVLDPASL